MAAVRANTKSTKETGLAGAMKIVVKTFLETKHYQSLHDLLSEEWSHCHSLTAAVRLMEAHGVHVSPEEEQRLAQLPEDRMIDALVMRMPQQSREQFEHFFLQLSLIASTTTRLRAALEAGNEAVVEEVMDSAENVGILQYILKMAVAQAGQEVKAHNQDHNDWLAATADRLAPLLQCQANAAMLNDQLKQAKDELTDHHTLANEKSKKMLMSIAGNSSAAIIAMSFHEWHELLVHAKIEAEIRKEYEEDIEAADKRLQDYIATQTETMRKMINKSAAAGEGGLVYECFQAFVGELTEKNAKIAEEAEMKLVEERMALFKASQASKSKSVLGRMNAGTDQGLLTLCVSAWIGAIAEEKKAKELEEKVKAEEAKIADFMKRQKDGAHSVLNRMSAATDAGLVQSMFAAWVEVWKEVKKVLEMEAQLNGAGGKFKSFGSRNKGAAMGLNERAAYAQEMSDYTIIFWYWKRETKVERMRRFAKDKNLKKKQQLTGVKGLFKNFANELEAGLSSGTPRPEDKGAPAAVQNKQRSGRKSSTSPKDKCAA